MVYPFPVFERAGSRRRRTNTAPRRPAGRDAAGRQGCGRSGPGFAPARVTIPTSADASAAGVLAAAAAAAGKAVDFFGGSDGAAHAAA